MTACGARVITVGVAAQEHDRTVLAARITAAVSGVCMVSGVSGVLSLLAADEGPVPGWPVLAGGLAGTLALVQALGDADVGAPLWVVTRGAVAAGSGEVLASPVQAQVWGLGRVAGLEHPERWGGLVDVPPVLDERAGGRLCSVLAGCGEDQVAIRGAGILARRLARAPLPRDGGVRWVPRGTVLVTGGTGAVGGHVARWVARRGARHVVLASRSGPAAAGAAALAAQLAAAGAGVEVIACDVAARAQVAGLLAGIGAARPPLSAVLHAAGALDDGVLDRLDTGRLATVLAAKAGGAALLDELTAGLRLEQFVLFSSAAATFGGVGQGNYAAANAFLDGLAQQRAARGLAGLSVAWGPWVGGMTEASEAVRQRLRRGPLPPMDPHLAAKALGQALGGPDSLLAVMDVDWAQFAAAPTAFVRDLPDVVQLARELSRDLAGEDLTRRLAGLPRARQIQVLTDLVRTGAAAVLGHASSEAVPAGRAFSELGLDSLTSLELRQQLNAATGLRLPATVLFDYPTPAVLTEYLWTQAFGRPAGHLPVMEELDRLEARLASAGPGDAGRAEITARLEALAQGFRAGPPDGAVPDPELQTATNDEMFDLVEKELRDSDFD
jgi:NAD(P)-dependent dehydrogenase (short-subunit alcohol dehydrogenase family)/acyl carrier protein